MFPDFAEHHAVICSAWLDLRIENPRGISTERVGAERDPDDKLGEAMMFA